MVTERLVRAVATAGFLVAGKGVLIALTRPALTASLPWCREKPPADECWLTVYGNH